MRNSVGSVVGDNVVVNVGCEGIMLGNWDGDDGCGLGGKLGIAELDGLKVGGGPVLKPEGKEHCGGCNGKH